MQDLLIAYIFYFLITLSILGFGYFFSKIFSIRLNLGEIGLSGILILIFISYITNFVTSHNFIHNSLVIFIGLFFFIFFGKSVFLKKKIGLILLISSILFIGILMHKTHDDFFYYHFPYTVSLIEHKKIFGLGNLEHGFRTPSSIFYLNSLFYLPIIDKSLIHSGAIFYLIFSNIFLIQKIFNKIKNKKKDFILILSILSFILINTIFSRIAEHGTDRSALILIFLLAIYFLESMNTKNSKRSFFFFYHRILILILLIVSLKSFYLIYYILVFTLFFQYKNILFERKFLLKLIYDKFNYFFIFCSLVFIFTVFSSSGCLIYPASFTCFENFSWSISKEEVLKMKSWYELWSKAGANPNFRSAEPLIYIQDFNWVKNWIETHFFNKISDYLLSILVIILVTLFFLKGTNKNNISKRKFLFFYLLLLILFVEWFVNHPALRYGGFTLIALLIFIPFSLYLEKHLKHSDHLKKNILILISISLILFFSKNVKRIMNEYEKYNYNPIKNLHYFIKDDVYYFNNLISRVHQKTNNGKFYIVLTKDLIKKIQDK